MPRARKFIPKPAGSACSRSGGRLLTAIFVALFLFIPAIASIAASSSPGGSGTESSQAIGRGTTSINSAIDQGGTWSFAVSADSRDCGNVVMPAIAVGVLAHHAAFYWHLGDFRYGSYFDEDMTHEVRNLKRKHPMRFGEYERNDWDDAIENQLLPFGNTPVFVTIGNHETYFKTKQDYLVEFANWLDTPIIREQRLRDNPTDFRLRTYYHWVIGGIDFFSLDNVSLNPRQFDKKQMQWFEAVLKRDESNPDIHSIVVGMHVPLPHSLVKHDMGASTMGMESGTRVYKDLLVAERKMHKHVYILNAHEHFYMADTYNSAYWRSHGGVLPGWTVATAGAVLNNLPKDYREAKTVKARVYGYLLGTVDPSGTSEGTIRFHYYQVKESDVPQSVVNKFAPEPAFVHWCFHENYRGGKPVPPVPQTK